MSRAGIPTTYRGTTFRSRLEARWAYLFDHLGIEWEYEPFDADGYIPDFALIGADPVLVEIKPAASLVDLVGPTQRVLEAVAAHWHHDVLFVGLSPIITVSSVWPDLPVMGLLREHADDWYEDDGAFQVDPGWDLAIWNNCGKCGQISVRHESGSYQSRICGHKDGDHYASWDEWLDTERVKRYWSEARDITRWTAA